MSNLAIFNFNNSPVRVVTIDGEPWWVARDVCDVLGFANGKSSLHRLDPDEVHSVNLEDAAGRNQDMTVISESGIYSLILRSRRPEAKAFKKWVTAEVLPNIRRTGAYIAPDAQPAIAPDHLGQLMAMVAQNLTALTSKAGQVDAKLDAIGEWQTEANGLLEEQDAEVKRIAAELADRDLVKRQLYRSEVERIKAQVFKEMTSRGLSVSKVAHDFWEAVKGRSGVASVKVESLTVSMAKRLFQESIRQAHIWNVSIVINLPLDVEEVA